MYICISLSLYIYIYIHMYIHIMTFVRDMIGDAKRMSQESEQARSSSTMTPRYATQNLTR